LTAGVVPDTFAKVKTTVDIDDTVLRQAERQSQQTGKPLTVLLEEALRARVGIAAPSKPAFPLDSPDTGLEEDDPFFRALEEIRERGRLAITRRDTALL
jgi:hypothetical protein